MADKENFDEINDDLKLLSEDEEDIEFDVDIDGNWDED